LQQLDEIPIRPLKRRFVAAQAIVLCLSHKHWATQIAATDSGSWAPRYVIPADRKWFERLAVGLVLAHTLVEIDPRFPKVTRSTVRRCSRSTGRSRRRRRRAQPPARSRPVSRTVKEAEVARR
jgi:hypothetical protein